MKSEDIPEPTIQRLSLYLRHLEECVKRQMRTISSKQLGESLQLTDAQVRKDLAYFGPFGHPGIGYRVEDLMHKIRTILGTDRTWQVVLVGAGNLGRALAAYKGFAKKPFQLTAVFDIDERKVGMALPGCTHAVQHMNKLEQVIHQQGAKLAIIAAPAACAQEVADRIIAAGIRGILNFAPVSLSVPADVSVASVDLAVQLEQLSFRVGGGEREIYEAESH